MSENSARTMQPELFAGPDLGIQALQARPVVTEPATGHICVLQHRAAWAVHAYLRFVGLPYSTENVASTRALDLPLPVMLDGHFITSSKVILPYIQQTYSVGPIDPEDAKHASWILTNLEDALAYLTNPREELHLLQSIAAYFLPHPKESKSRFEGCSEKEVVARMEPVYKYMHDRLEHQEFIGGDEPGMADAVLFQHVADVLALVDSHVRSTLQHYKHLIMFFRRICNRYFNFYDFDAVGVMVSIQLWEESNKVIRSNEKFRQSVALSLDVDVFTPLPEDPAEVVFPPPMSVTLITPIGESPPIESILHSEEEAPAPGGDQPATSADASAATAAATAPARRGRAARPSFRSRRLEFPTAALQNKKLRNAADRTFITNEANLYADDEEGTAARPRNRLLEELTEGQLTLMKAKFHLKQQRFEMNNRVVKQNRPKRMVKAKSATRLVPNQSKQRPTSLQQGRRTMSSALNSTESKAERLAALRQPIGEKGTSAVAVAAAAGLKEGETAEKKDAAEVPGTQQAGVASRLQPTLEEEPEHVSEGEDGEEEDVKAFEEQAAGSDEEEEETDNGLTLQQIVAAARGEGLSEYLPEHMDKMEQEQEAAAALGIAPLKPAPKPLPIKSPKQFHKPASRALDTIHETAKEPEPEVDVSQLEDLIDFNDQDQVQRFESAFAREAPVHDEQVVWMWPTLRGGPGGVKVEEPGREVPTAARQRWDMVKQATSTAFIVTSLSMLAMYTQRAY